MNKTLIEWALNPDGTPGYTWNPITGCLNGCEYCYARKLANTRLKERYLANKNVAHQDCDYPSYREATRDYYSYLKDPFYPRFWSDRCNRTGMIMGKSPKGIFVCDMSDLFGIGIPEQWTHRVLDRCRDMCLHRFYLLTKQPQNLINFSPFPDNAWVGVSATDDDMLSSAILYLHNIKARVKYISFEPLLGQVKDLSFTLKYSHIIDWVIIGAQTKPYKPPKWEWVSEIIEACVKAGTPYFLKNNLEPIVPKVFGGDGNLIQEFPK